MWKVFDGVWGMRGRRCTHLVAVGSQYDSVVESISNVTEVCGKCGKVFDGVWGMRGR